MAAIQPFVNLQPFKGTETENLNEFLRQLESCTNIAGINNADRHRYLHLHLKGGALTYFDQLPQATRDDLRPGHCSSQRAIPERPEDPIAEDSLQCTKDEQI